MRKSAEARSDQVRKLIARRFSNYKRNEFQEYANCPVCGAYASIVEHDDRFRINCRDGCHEMDVLARVGLGVFDLAPQSSRTRSHG